jgi:hypothetical protein
LLFYLVAVAPPRDCAVCALGSKLLAIESKLEAAEFPKERTQKER